MLVIVQIWDAQKQEVTRRVGATSRRSASKIAKVLHNRRHSVMPARFRFTPESGHVRCNYGCPLRAKSRHLIYSMISSARPIKESGTDKPSALAALILII